MMEDFFDRWVSAILMATAGWVFVAGFWGVVIAVILPSEQLITDHAGRVVITVALSPFLAAMASTIAVFGVYMIVEGVRKLLR